MIKNPKYEIVLTLRNFWLLHIPIAKRGNKQVYNCMVLAPHYYGPSDFYYSPREGYSPLVKHLEIVLKRRYENAHFL